MKANVLRLINESKIWIKRRNLSKAREALQNALNILDEKEVYLKAAIGKKIFNLQNWQEKITEGFAECEECGCSLSEDQLIECENEEGLCNNCYQEKEEEIQKEEHDEEFAEIWNEFNKDGGMADL